MEVVQSDGGWCGTGAGKGLGERRYGSAMTVGVRQGDADVVVAARGYRAVQFSESIDQ